MKKGRLAHTLSVLVDLPTWPPRCGTPCSSRRRRSACARRSSTNAPSTGPSEASRSMAIGFGSRPRHSTVCSSTPSRSTTTSSRLAADRPPGQGGLADSAAAARACGTRAGIRTAPRAARRRHPRRVLCCRRSHRRPAEEPAAGVVLVGIAGLAWQDVTVEDAPTLHSLVGPNAVASLTVRTVRPRTCVVDGWLTVGAGRRVTDRRGPRRRRRTRPVLPRGAGTDHELADGSAAVPGWDALVETQEEQSFDTRLGLLGGRIAEAGPAPRRWDQARSSRWPQRRGRSPNYAPDPATGSTRRAHEVPGDGRRPGFGALAGRAQR